MAKPWKAVLGALLLGIALLIPVESAGAYSPAGQHLERFRDVSNIRSKQPWRRLLLTALRHRLRLQPSAVRTLLFQP